MAVAIPFIAGALASAGATAEGVVLFEGISVATSAAIIGGAASLAASVLISALNKPSSPSPATFLNQIGANRTAQFRQPTAPHEVVFGRIKKSGPIMFVSTATDDGGRDQGYFYIQIALASHHCRAIADVYIFDQLSTDSVFTGLVTIGKHLGATDQVEDATFLADLPDEFTGHRLRGRANLAARLKGDATAFPNGVPNFVAIVWGADEIYDPRTGTYGWTNNPILILCWWMIWGEGYLIGDFNSASLIAAANVCDERVLVYQISTTFTVDGSALILADGARSLDVGDGVVVSSSGALPSGLVVNTVYYVYPSDGGTITLCSTVANAFAGAGITLGSAGSGTLTLTYYDEARYKCNGSFNLDSDKFEIRDQLKTSCLGDAIEIGGVWFLSAGAAAIPVFVLGEDDLRAAMVTTPKRSLKDRINGVRCVFINPDNNWQPSDAPPLLNPTYLAQDENTPLYASISLPFTTSARAAQRIMKVTLELNRRERSIKFPAKLTAMRLRPLDGVYLSNERYGWLQEQHRVMGWVLATDGGIDLLLQQDDPNVWAWDASEELTVAAAQAVVVPDRTQIAAPASITVTAPLTAIYSTVIVVLAEVKSIWLDGYEGGYRLQGGSDWFTQSINRSTVFEVPISVAADFRARAVTKRGTNSAYVQNLAPNAPTGAAEATGVSISWVNGSGAAQVQIFKNSTNDFSSSTFYATVPAAPQAANVLNNAYYWLRSVSSSGNVSAQTSTVTVGTP